MSTVTAAIYGGQLDLHVVGIIKASLLLPFARLISEDLLVLRHCLSHFLLSSITILTTSYNGAILLILYLLMLLIAALKLFLIVIQFADLTVNTLDVYANFLGFFGLPEYAHVGCY